ncbi:putative disease resistance protein RGA3 isoform X1 [Prunus avium]|uniref:Disease resistance protein RGA3 isoform X1 n=1 Tax=Prunus avium TaxID=42229 RepID=A0A6P5SFH8_PRUAV|nr:putative disease resistance protein RGA3 isoform X1 [Prunus avium]XP_021813050.1 putative disease resistance protein RGA3 isoform X1 [Prunus avium]XP_021813051.1 putative disease resistance protein RGA3 isoform X1 [Prunus avium]XP_021813052.1 putative disease resistance protein RGA3 isoform X1 [Prunus avium]XP_021813053.1 putative disease resistance protein RGA3 isoform X1 [Prunus avium]XP_021813054.1 putative disease resistance protein RGA3 isoform X1 [Prunus avium]XP_021813055.1 putative
MGGMGKTTLSQLAYNDENVKSYFEKRIWVCVSEPFDEIKIAKAIINGAKGTTPESDELEDFLQCMSESIAAKKLLLVLDDVWTQDQRKWEKLETPLIQSCAKGSRILVTTRKQEIAIMMGATTHMIHMEELSEQDCLSIFKHTAFSGREKFESNELESIGKEIAKKCKGLPLAAKTMGSLMRYKETRREWQDVLDSKIWDLQEVEQQVFQPLLLSYYDLAPAIRRCLLYCAIFPKDYEFNKDRLVELWMSQDFLNLKGNQEKKVIGQRFFGNLVMRSFFQDLVKDEDGNIIGCKMHDIVHDFVQFLTKSDCVCMEATGTNIETELLRANYTIGLGDNKIRHLTLMFAPKGPFPLSVSSCNFKNLRSLTALDSKITTIHSNLLLELKCLRTLNLSHNLIKEVPEEIVELVHLRYIDFSFNPFLRKLPNAVCDLYNLQTLRFVGCYGLQNLPQSMGKLINLSHLYVSGCDKLKYLPKGIMGLQSLRTLDEFRVCGSDNDEALKLGDLGTLDQLQGVLRIRIPGNGEDGEAEKAQLWNKKQISHLKLIFENFQNEERKSSSVEIVLNVLRPQQDLEYLDIRCYHGISGPNWMMSLHNLRILILHGWNESQFLPPLGKLPSLERLMISDMRKVKKVGDEFLGIENQTSIKSSSSACILFPKLKQLRLVSMSGLQEWEGGVKEEDSDKITIMPCLSSLNITLCSGLKTLPGFLLKSPLQNLFFRHCRNLARSYRQGTGKEWPKISHIPNITIDETDPDFDDEEGHEIVQEKDVL